MYVFLAMTVVGVQCYIATGAPYSAEKGKNPVKIHRTHLRTTTKNRKKQDSLRIMTVKL